MSAHTPGPWEMATVPTTVGSCHKIGPFPSGGQSGKTYACVYADGCRIGVDDNIPNAVELRANARLIAAAPDLLAALRDIADMTNGARAGEIARTAIAKATS